MSAGAVLVSDPLGAVHVRSQVLSIGPAGRSPFPLGMVGAGTAAGVAPVSGEDSASAANVSVAVLVEAPSVCSGVPLGRVTRGCSAEDVAADGKDGSGRVVGGGGGGTNGDDDGHSNAGAAPPAPTAMSALDAAVATGPATSRLTLLAQETANALAALVDVAALLSERHELQDWMQPQSAVDRALLSTSSHSTLSSSIAHESDAVATHTPSVSVSDGTDTAAAAADVMSPARARAQSLPKVQLVVHAFVTASDSLEVQTLLGLSPVAALLPSVLEACTASLMACAVPFTASPIAIPVVRVWRWARRIMATRIYLLPATTTTTTTTTITAHISHFTPLPVHL